MTKLFVFAWITLLSGIARSSEVGVTVQSPRCDSEKASQVADGTGTCVAMRFLGDGTGTCAAARLGDGTGTCVAMTARESLDDCTLDQLQNLIRNVGNDADRRLILEKIRALKGAE